MNIPNIQAKFTEHKIDALLLFTSQNIRYAVGFPVDDGAVLITRERAWLFTDSRYIEAARAGVRGAEVVQFTQEKPLTGCLKAALASCGAKAVGAEEDGLSHGQWRTYEEKLGMPLTCAGDLVKSLRAVFTQASPNSRANFSGRSPRLLERINSSSPALRIVCTHARRRGVTSLTV